MKIRLIDVDGHNFPNLPLMKLSAWHKQQGDSVEWYEPLLHGFPNAPLDKVYMSLGYWPYVMVYDKEHTKPSDTVRKVQRCSKQEREISEAVAKSKNRCHDFAYSSMDAFGENKKGYTPRVPKKKQCDGQIEMKFGERS